MFSMFSAATKCGRIPASGCTRESATRGAQQRRRKRFFVELEGNSTQHDLDVDGEPGDDLFP